MLLIERSFSARSWTIFSHTFCHFSVLPRDIINEQQSGVFPAMQTRKNAGNKRRKRTPVCIIGIYFRIDNLAGNESLGCGVSTPFIATLCRNEEIYNVFILNFGAILIL